MIQQKTQTWQHEETGRLVDFPFGKNPGRRWYLLPQIKTKNPSRGGKMRTSQNEYDKTGRLINGYDYDNQAWVIDGKYVRCGHPESMDCGCYGKEHEGEKTK